MSNAKFQIGDFKTKQVLVFKEIKSGKWTVWTPCKSYHLGYLDELTLIDAKFCVIEKSRQRILKTRKRFPHAWIIGKLLIKIGSHRDNQITYNPFKDKKFQSNGKDVYRRKKVVLKSDGKVYVGQ